MDYVAEFERHLFEDGKSPSTILSYVGDIKGFLAHLESQGNRFGGQLTRLSITSYKRDLEDREYKINTINKKINSWSALINS